MGQFRWVAALALLWASAASAQNTLGTFFVQLDNVRIVSTFERDSQLGSYVHNGEVVDFNLTMFSQNKEGKTSKPNTKNVRMPLGPQDLIVSLQRQGNQATLQFYTFVIDPSVRMKIPVMEVRRIQLKPGHSWDKYESGGTVAATIIDPREEQESQLMLSALGEDYFEGIVRQLIEGHGATATTPSIEIPKKALRTFLISKNQIVMVSEGGSVRIKSDIGQMKGSDFMEPRKLNKSSLMVMTSYSEK